MNSITAAACPSARLGWCWLGIRTPQRVSMGRGCNWNARFFPFYMDIPRSPFVAAAKKKNSKSEPVLKPSIIEEVYIDDDDEEEGIEDGNFIEDFEEDEFVEDGSNFEDEYFEEEAELSPGDGAGGGGIALAGAGWDRTALAIAEEVALSFDGELGIYAFRTLLNATIQVRIERLTKNSGSPSMEDIEAFSTAYRERLDEAESSGSIPGNISLEVSSPGVERVVRIPQDLERFKDRNLYVKYMVVAVDTGSSTEHDGIFRLISFDPESKSCTWGLADVRINREKSGKGRPLSKKQKEWRLNTPFDTIRLVRLYSEI